MNANNVYRLITSPFCPLVTSKFKSVSSLYFKVCRPLADTTVFSQNPLCQKSKSVFCSDPFLSLHFLSRPPDSPRQLHFSGEIDPSILSKCDLCFTEPCQNGASCRSLPNRDFECRSVGAFYKQLEAFYKRTPYLTPISSSRCAPGFYGKTCTEVIDACYGNPCVNGANCQVLEAGRFL